MSSRPPALRSLLACPERVRVAFLVHLSAASPRAADTAAFDYADQGEQLLGFTAYIVLLSTDGAPAPLVERFRDRFRDRVLELDSEIEDSLPLLQAHGITHLYIYKFGHEARPSLAQLSGRGVRLLVHAAFDGRTPHGDAYARVSPCVRGGAPVVPHVVRRRDPDGPDLREELGIPYDALVFGRHGGYDGFDLPTAQQAVLRVAAAAPATFFIFAHTAPFGGGPPHHPPSPRQHPSAPRSSQPAKGHSPPRQL